MQTERDTQHLEAIREDAEDQEDEEGHAQEDDES